MVWRGNPCCEKAGSRHSGWKIKCEVSKSNSAVQFLFEAHAEGCPCNHVMCENRPQKIILIQVPPWLGFVNLFDCFRRQAGGFRTFQNILKALLGDWIGRQ